MAAEVEITIDDIGKQMVQEWINTHAVSLAGGQPCEVKPNLCPLCRCPRCGQE